MTNDQYTLARKTGVLEAKKRRLPAEVGQDLAHAAIEWCMSTGRDPGENMGLVRSRIRFEALSMVRGSAEDPVGLFPTDSPDMSVEDEVFEGVVVSAVEAKVEAIVEAIPDPNARRLMRERYIEGVNPKDLAGRYGVKPGTMRKRLHLVEQRLGPDHRDALRVWAKFNDPSTRMDGLDGSDYLARLLTKAHLV